MIDCSSHCMIGTHKPTGSTGLPIWLFMPGGRQRSRSLSKASTVMARIGTANLTGRCRIARVAGMPSIKSTLMSIRIEESGLATRELDRFCAMALKTAEHGARLAPDCV